MKQLYLSTLRYAAAVLCLLLALPALPQSRNAQPAWLHTPMNADKTIDGFYESLPADYTSTTKDFPLLVYLHGDESVEGTHEDILENGIPKLIVDGSFPETFRVKGQTHSFIIIAPHYTTKTLSPGELEEALQFILKKYRVNTGRIYLTGMSRGGGYTWQYAGAAQTHATTLAAIVPVASATQPERETATIIGNANLPVWATHNKEDYLVPASNTITFVDWVNDRKPEPRAQLTLFNSKEHEGWTRTFDPASKAFKGKNIYEWMLQHTRNEEIPLPVTLTTYKAFQSAAAQVTLSWSIAQTASNNGYFTLERSTTQQEFTKVGTVPVTAQDTYTYIDSTPLPGTNYYRLSQTDADGSTTYFPVLKINLSTSGQPVLSLYPNPITSQAVIKITHPENGTLSLVVFSAAGTLMQQWTMQKQATIFQRSLSFPNLPPGSYVLQVKGKTFEQAIPFVKQ
jgi:dienelactone hydrolase